jgi:hypothetical protein
MSLQRGGLRVKTQSSVDVQWWHHWCRAFLGGTLSGDPSQPVAVVVVGCWCYFIYCGCGGALGPCWKRGAEGPWGCSLRFTRLVQLWSRWWLGGGAAFIAVLGIRVLGWGVKRWVRWDPHVEWPWSVISLVPQRECSSETTLEQRDRWPFVCSLLVKAHGGRVQVASWACSGLRL